ncbi:MAG TPA: hypothetical protein VH092_39095 [Urbifossiella sp.]|nr:hypothetical protein [Urbifossiella sp.]
MDSPVIAPFPPGTGGPIALSPKQAKNYFEFFPSGSHREVLLLGELVEQWVHFVRTKGHKVLCAARHGPCELCEKAAIANDDISIRQTEYYAASYVRGWRDRQYDQRVSVFSDAAGEELLKLAAGAAHRGLRLDVERKAHGNTSRFKLSLLTAIPRGFPIVLPQAFDLVPFIRARFGRAQDPRQPLVFLPAFKCEPVIASGGRPKPLNLSADDCAPADEIRAKLKAYRERPEVEDKPAAPASVPVPAAESPPAAPPKAVIEPAIDVVPEVLRDKARPRPAADELPAGIGGELDVIARAAVPGFYGPRLLVQQPLDVDAELDSVAKLCGDLKAERPFLHGKQGANGNGHHATNGKGGTK